MSKTADKQLKRRIEHAEFMWEKAQIKAASAQSVLDYMVEQFHKFNSELTPEQIEQTQEQITLRQKEIKKFLMDEKETYEKRLGVIS